MLQFINNKNGKAIPFFQGKALCSFQRPLSEAQNWIKLFELKNVSEFCVLGAGGGYHIKYLHLLYPNKKITVIDFNLDLIEALSAEFKNSQVEFIHFDSMDIQTQFHPVKNIYKLLLEKMPTLMPFRPGWQGREELYSNLLLKMTQREAKALQDQWKSMSLELDFNWNVLNEEKNFLTLKNLLNATDSFSSFDGKILHLFDEIIK